LSEKAINVRFGDKRTLTTEEWKAELELEDRRLLLGAQFLSIECFSERSEKNICEQAKHKLLCSLDRA
jgi:hypothetical protein